MNAEYSEISLSLFCSIFKILSVRRLAYITLLSLEIRAQITACYLHTVRFLAQSQGQSSLLCIQLTTSHTACRFGYRSPLRIQLTTLQASPHLAYYSLPCVKLIDLNATSKLNTARDIAHRSPSSIRFIATPNLAPVTTHIRQYARKNIHIHIHTCTKKHTDSYTRTLAHLRMHLYFFIRIHKHHQLHTLGHTSSYLSAPACIHN